MVEFCALERGLDVSAKSIDLCHHVDMDENCLLVKPGIDHLY